MTSLNTMGLQNEVAKSKLSSHDFITLSKNTVQNSVTGSLNPD